MYRFIGEDGGAGIDGDGDGRGGVNIPHAGVGLAFVEGYVSGIRAVVEGDGGVVVEGLQLEVDVFEVAEVAGVAAAVGVQVFAYRQAVGVGGVVCLEGVNLPGAADVALVVGPDGVGQVNRAAAGDETVSTVVANVV